MLALLVVVGWSGTLHADPTRQVVPVGRTLEATPGYPRIHVQLRPLKADGTPGEPLTGKAMTFGALQSLQSVGGLGDLSDLDGMLDDAQGPSTSFKAFLDTGASAYVISKTTAKRFGIQAERDAVYHETGLHGEIPMKVSVPYALSLASSSGRLMDQPDALRRTDDAARLLMNRKPPQNAIIELAMGAIDVIGMPAIKEYVVEIDPTPMSNMGDAAKALNEIQSLEDLQHGDFMQKLGKVGVGPAVTLHPPDHEPKDVDFVVPLQYVNYARRQNPRDKGPLPSLAKNPMIQDVTTTLDGTDFTTDWFLDTGAPASIISTEHATALGLYDANGNPTRAQDFAIPLGGVGGKIRQVPGFRLDRLRVPTAGGHVLEYRNVSVLVTDVSTELDNGETVTLHGIFGTNLLMPTVAGLGGGLPTDMAPPPYARVWIDGPNGRLLLQMHDKDASDRQ